MTIELYRSNPAVSNYHKTNNPSVFLTTCRDTCLNPSNTNSLKLYHSSKTNIASYKIKSERRMMLQCVFIILYVFSTRIFTTNRITILDFPTLVSPRSTTLKREARVDLRVPWLKWPTECRFLLLGCEPIVKFSIGLVSSNIIDFIDGSSFSMVSTRPI